MPMVLVSRAPLGSMYTLCVCCSRVTMCYSLHFLSLSVCCKTDCVTQEHLNHCWLKLKNFAVHSYCIAWIIMVDTGVVNYVLYINLLPQTLDIKPRFILQFVVYCILLIVSIQLLLLYQINHYYYYNIIITIPNSCTRCAVCRKHLHSQPQHSVYCSTFGLCFASVCFCKTISCMF